MKTIDAQDMHYKDLNEIIKELVKSGEDIINLKNVNGQRYIGDSLNGKTKINIEGTPGNDLAAFMDGLTIEVFGNGQDAIGNTMNDGNIIVHGHVGDVAGYGMRGGTMYIENDAGYRVGIHMKQYKDKIPVLVIGGTSGDFFGEYMAGGCMIVLNLKNNKDIVGEYCGTGMHGGVIFLRGDVEDYKLGKEVIKEDATDDDLKVISKYVKNFSSYFDYDFDKIMNHKFIKLHPAGSRPYGKLYA
ncbi:hypothetical protein [Thermoanaerobacterium thermosaccharolyticum]|uniref:GltB/FmdC/FwdC-like GXGXG domain-containing protein n=1 Tax=Thermoanaerobacterium thermosaccharolyticum TaxID=1517 RepID=UPI00123A88A8|nr:hypothetical protein [Thermoanaerobacterium thermosaccharolyticum]KAA5808471.1 hypothetical protein F1655_01315 [Thermoanaerobacterium thermosaccharolyticum]